MRPSFHIHLPEGSSAVESCIEDKRERDVILDIGGERFLTNRDVIKTFPATRSEPLTFYCHKICDVTNPCKTGKTHES